MVGFVVASLLFLIILLFSVLGTQTESADIAKQCKSYSMATIDDKVYNCTLK